MLTVGLQAFCHRIEDFFFFLTNFLGLIHDFEETNDVALMCDLRYI